MLPTGQGGGASHQRWNLLRPPGRLACFPSPAGRLYGFRRRRRRTSPAGTVSQPIGKPFNGQAKGLLWLTWRSYAGPPQYYIPPEGESPQPVREASAGPGQNPWRPGPKGPAAPSTLARESGRQPSGILESTAPVPVPIPTAPQAPEPSNPIYAYKKTGTLCVGFLIASLIVLISERRAARWQCRGRSRGGRFPGP